MTKRKAQLNPINIVVLLLLMVLLIVIFYLIISQISEKARNATDTMDPNSNVNIFPEFHKPDVKIQSIYMRRSGSALDIRVDVLSYEKADADLNFTIRSYPDSMVEKKSEREIIGEGPESLSFTATETGNGAYYLIVEIRTLQGTLVDRQGKWIDDGYTGYVPTTSTVA